MAKAEDKNTRFRRLLPSVVLWLAAIIFYAASSYNALLHGRTWTDEVAYLIKSYWYASGAAAPFTASDATGTMPLYFFQLGFWQELVGIGLVNGRALSIALGALSAVILFVVARRLTANTTIASAAVFAYLATPATAYYFATATPAASVAVIHLAAVWLVVSGLGRPRIWASLLMGVLCTALFFYSQNMILAVIVLLPLYILAIGRARLLNGALALGAAAASTAGMIYVFPEKLLHYALRMPGLTPLLESAGWAPTNFTFLDQGTVDAATMDLAFDQLDWAALLDSFALPYSGTIVFALLLFVLAGKGLRVLWIAPLYFVWLSVAHFIGAAGTCATCMSAFAPQFAAIGALAAALTLAMGARWARENDVSPVTLVIGSSIVIAGANAVAPQWALSEEFAMFPLSRTSMERQQTEEEKIGELAQWIASRTSPGEPALVIHGVGGQHVPELTLAAFMAGHSMPPQSIDMLGTYRRIKTDLSGAAHEAVQGAVEEESLWTTATMRRWINRDYDLILLQENPRVDQSERFIRINSFFNHIATTNFGGAAIHLYERRPAQ